MLDMIQRINVRGAGLALAVGYTIFNIWIYVARPQGLQDVIGCVGFERSAFETGLELFRRDDFLNAQDEFEGADPRQCDEKTQFYLAYSHYRAGCSRVPWQVDTEQIARGLEAVDRAIELTSGEEMSVDDRRLSLDTPQALKEALEQGSLERAVQGCR